MIDYGIIDEGGSLPWMCERFVVWLWLEKRKRWSEVESEAFCKATARLR